MTDEQFVAKFGEEYLKVLNNAQNKQFNINEENFEKFHRIVEFFKHYVEENGGGVLKVDVTPEEIHSGVEASFVVFDITGDKIKAFADVIKGASAFGIDSTTDGKICISITVADVFSEK